MKIDQIHKEKAIDYKSERFFSSIRLCGLTIPEMFFQR